MLDLAANVMNKSGQFVETLKYAQSQMYVLILKLATWQKSNLIK